jgi:hypothetical protein
VRARWLWWLCLAVTSVGVLALVAFVLSHDDPKPGLSDRGWLTLALAALLLVLLYVHHRRGAWPLLRALTEYAVVALLAVLLTFTATGYGVHQPAGKQTGKQQATKQPASRASTAPKAGDGCPPVRQVPAWITCLWRQANPPDPKPEQGRAMPRFPTPSTRRTR